MMQSTHPFHKIFFHIPKYLACHAEKTLTVEDSKKRVNINNIYTYIICDKNDSKYK